MNKARLLFLLLLISSNLFSQNWDINITKAINPNNPNSDFWKGMTNSVTVVAIAAPVSYFTTGVIRKNPELKHKSYEMVATFFVESVITQGMKYAINRPRPAETYPNEIFPYQDEHGKSMPSGHTALAFATATSLALAEGKWYVAVPAYLWAAGVGYSRMYLGVHYFSDVMVGAAVGVASGFVTHYVFKKWIYKKDAKKPIHSTGL